MLGKELVSYLRRVYEERANYCVVLISQHYVAGRWPGKVELPSILARSTSGKSEDYLLPVLLDDTKVAGLPDTIGYVDGRKKSPAVVAQLILGKLALHPMERSELELFERLFRDESFTGKFVTMFLKRHNPVWLQWSLDARAAVRFERRESFGKLLGSYGLGTVETNLSETDVDVYLRVSLTPKGRRLRNYLWKTLSASI